MKNIIKGLSEKKKEEIIHMSLRELYQVGYDAGFADGQAVLSTVVNEGIIHEGKLMRKVDREAREGDYAMFGGLSKYYSEHYTENGKLYKVLNDGRYIGKNGTNYGVYNWSECPHPEIFEVVEGCNPQIPMYNEAIEPIPAPLTANQQRYELIQRAREFVEDALNSLKSEGLVINFDYYKNPTISFFQKGNKTTCVITPENTMLKRFVGRAFCSVGEVFNEWIGKAIALAKALKIDIPSEFLNAVQPDEVVVGMVVMDNFFSYGKLTVIDNHDSVRDGLAHLGSPCIDSAIIIDDTNAEYQLAVG